MSKTFLALLPALALVAMTPTFIVIMLGQAVAVFVLCLMSKNRFAALLIGLVGAVVAASTGGKEYDVIDVFFVAVATLAAVWKMTPYGEGETPSQLLAFASKAAGVVILAIGAIGWFWFNGENGHAPAKALPPEPVSEAPQSAMTNERSRPPARHAAEFVLLESNRQAQIIEAPEPVIVPQQPLTPPRGRFPDWKFSEVKFGMTEAEIIAIIGPPARVVEVRSSDGRKTSAMWNYVSESGSSHSFMMHNGRYQ